MGHDCTLFLAIRSLSANCRNTENPKKHKKIQKKNHYIVFLTREVVRRQKIQKTLYSARDREVAKRQNTTKKKTTRSKSTKAQNNNNNNSSHWLVESMYSRSV